MFIGDLNSSLPQCWGDKFVINLQPNNLDLFHIVATDKLAGSTLNLGDLRLILLTGHAVAKVCHYKGRDFASTEEAPLIHPPTHEEQAGATKNRVVDIKEGDSLLVERHITTLAKPAGNGCFMLCYMGATIHFLRHGEVENPEKILYGRQPGWRLSTRGQEMAKAVAEWSKALDLGAVIASPLQRAQETAAPVAEIHGLPITTEERLIEATNRFEGEKFEFGSGVLRHPKSWRYLWNPWRPSWGEPYEEQISRMLGALFIARDAAGGKDAIAVSHQLPIWILRSAIEGRRLLHDPRKRECALASVTSFVLDDDGMVADCYYTEPAKHLLTTR
jgi:broad specificity phosphatase PhoE